MTKEAYEEAVEYIYSIPSVREADALDPIRAHVEAKDRRIEELERELAKRDEWMTRYRDRAKHLETRIARGHPIVLWFREGTIKDTAYSKDRWRGRTFCELDTIVECRAVPVELEDIVVESKT